MSERAERVFSRPISFDKSIWMLGGVIEGSTVHLQVFHQQLAEGAS
jgi:hypothetical protein